MRKKNNLQLCLRFFVTFILFPETMSKPITPPSSKVDWATMGFQYRDLNGFMRYTWTEENGWDNGRFETNPKLDVHMCSTGLNYGQQVEIDI